MEIPIQDIVNILITGTLFVVILAGFIVLLAQLFNKAKRNFALEKENLSREIETQLLQTQLEIQEQTLEKVSQEIHDNIGQTLSFVKLSINTIDLNNAQQTQDKLTESKDLVTKAIQDLRNLSKSLNTNFIKETGLIASIEYQLAFLHKTGLYDTHFQSSDTTYSFAPDTEIVLFRVVQELLNNIVKHAEASRIQVCMDYTDEALKLMIVDNGKGFDKAILENKPQSKGLGLTNMKKRLDLVHSSINIDSSIGAGTTVSILVLNQDSPAVMLS